jgi:iron(III) transport system ATP-binding protein
MTLQLIDVAKVFTSAAGREHAAVDGLTLDIAPGTFCTLLGPSGCGKTTTLRLIAGFELPTRGEILFDGRSLNGVPPYRRGFPMVFQSYALFPHMTVQQNVEYGLRLRSTRRADAATRAGAALDMLGLSDQAAKYPAQLSGGQQQRVALARCLVLEPRVILFDEPLSNLDAGLRVAMRREIRALQQRLGVTAVYVTHDQEEALAVSDRIIIMNGGRVEQDGAPEQVHRRPASEFVARFMGSQNIIDVIAGTPGGVKLMGEWYAGTDVPPGTSRAVVRADALHFSDAGRHAATVAERTYLGARVQYVLLLRGGERIVVDEHGAAAEWSVGDHAAFDLAPERLHYLGSG